MTEKNQKYLVFGLVTLGVIGLGTMLYFRKKIVSKAMDYVSKSVYAKINKQKLSELHPAFRQRYIDFFNELEEKGYSPLVTSGYRSFQSQANEHAKNSNAAEAGHSLHNYALVIDMNIMKPKQIGGLTSDAQWKPIVDIAKKHGLDWGGTLFPDYGGKNSGIGDRVHFQPVELKNVTGTKLLALKNAGKVDSKGFVKLVA